MNHINVYLGLTSALVIAITIAVDLALISHCIDMLMSRRAWIYRIMLPVFMLVFLFGMYIIETYL